MNDHHETAGVAAVRRRLYDTFRDWADPHLSGDAVLDLYGRDWLWRLSRTRPTGSWLDDAVTVWVAHRDAYRIVNDVLGFEDGPKQRPPNHPRTSRRSPDLGLDLG